MGLVQYAVIALMLSAQLALTSPLPGDTHGGEDQACRLCPAGTFQKSCNVCESCPGGKFTAMPNHEESCHRCFGDCRPDYHLKVAANCTKTSDLRCVCEDGFVCNEKVRYSDNCRDCVEIRRTTTTEATLLTTGHNKQATPSASSAHTRASDESCRSTNCVSPSVQPPVDTEVTSTKLAAILCPAVGMGCVALVILLCVRRPGGETCFKQAIAELCNGGRRDTSHKSKESSQPRDSFSAKQQPPSLSAANLGPVHVHNPGTVIFSLLSQFTGQVGPMVEGGTTADRAGSEEEDERDCPVCQPTSSPSIHLSEEERSGEIDSIFFPSQEQGKDCHVSKEEEL